MVVFFVPEQVAGTSGSNVVQHLVGIQLSPSLAVVATSVAQEQQQPASRRLPAEVLQTVLDRIDPPPGWPQGSLRVLGGIGGSGPAEVARAGGLLGRIRLYPSPDGTTPVYVLPKPSARIFT